MSARARNTRAPAVILTDSLILGVTFARADPTDPWSPYTCSCTFSSPDRNKFGKHKCKLPIKSSPDWPTSTTGSHGQAGPAASAQAITSSIPATPTLSPRAGQGSTYRALFRSPGPYQSEDQEEELSQTFRVSRLSTSSRLIIVASIGLGLTSRPASPLAFQSVALSVANTPSKRSLPPGEDHDLITSPVKRPRPELPVARRLQFGSDSPTSQPGPARPPQSSSFADESFEFDPSIVFEAVRTATPLGSTNPRVNPAPVPASSQYSELCLDPALLAERVLDDPYSAVPALDSDGPYGLATQERLVEDLCERARIDAGITSASQWEEYLDTIPSGLDGEAERVLDDRMSVDSGDRIGSQDDDDVTTSDHLPPSQREDMVKELEEEFALLEDKEYRTEVDLERARSQQDLRYCPDDPVVPDMGLPGHECLYGESSIFAHRQWDRVLNCSPLHVIPQPAGHSIPTVSSSTRPSPSSTVNSIGSTWLQIPMPPSTRC